MSKVPVLIQTETCGCLFQAIRGEEVESFKIAQEALEKLQDFKAVKQISPI